MRGREEAVRQELGYARVAAGVGAEGERASEREESPRLAARRLLVAAPRRRVHEGKEAAALRSRYRHEWSHQPVRAAKDSSEHHHAAVRVRRCRGDGGVKGGGGEEAAR